MADVPVGVFLSGGLDSTALAALATRAAGRPSKCFTIGFRAEDSALEQSSDDARFARMAAESLGAEFHEIEVSPDIVDLLPKVIWHLDEPIADPAAIATYLISEAARRDVTVLLSGQGADEIFAGYRVHAMPLVATACGHCRLRVREVRRRALVAALPPPRIVSPACIPALYWPATATSSKMLAGVDLPADERYVFYRSYYTDEELARPLRARPARTRCRRRGAGSEHLDYFERSRRRTSSTACSTSTGRPSCRSSTWPTATR